MHLNIATIALSLSDKYARTHARTVRACVRACAKQQEPALLHVIYAYNQIEKYVIGQTNDIFTTSQEGTNVVDVSGDSDVPKKENLGKQFTLIKP